MVGVEVMDCSKILIPHLHLLPKIVEVLAEAITQLPNLYHAHENKVITFRKGIISNTLLHDMLQNPRKKMMQLNDRGTRKSNA